MAKIEVKLNKENTLLQGDVVIVDWKDKTKSVFIVSCLSEPYKQPRKMLCSLDGGGFLNGFCNLGNITYKRFQEKIGTDNKVTIIKKENLHMIIENINK